MTACLGIARGAVELVGDDRGDALVGQGADRDGAGGDQLGACRVDILEQPEHAETGAEALLGMRPVGQDGDDEPLGLGADRAPPATEPLGRPFGVTPMRTRHVIGIGAVPAAAVTALMHGDALAAMEDLDHAGGHAGIDLLADQLVRHRIEEAVDLDVVVERHAGEAPFGELVVGIRQRRQGGPLEGLEQLPAADAEPAHDVRVDALQRGGDRRVRLGQREEGLPAKPPEDVGLGKTHPASTSPFAGLSWPCRKDADAVMGRHHAVAAIDFRVVERGPVDAGFQIVGHDEARHPAKEAEHPDMGLDPVRQCLRPGCLGVGVIGGPKDRDSLPPASRTTPVARFDNHDLLAVIRQIPCRRRGFDPWSII